jgi:hypothetical protein
MLAFCAQFTVQIIFGSQRRIYTIYPILLIAYFMGTNEFWTSEFCCYLEAKPNGHFFQTVKYVIALYPHSKCSFFIEFMSESISCCFPVVNKFCGGSIALSFDTTRKAYKMTLRTIRALLRVYWSPRELVYRAVAWQQWEDKQTQTARWLHKPISFLTDEWWKNISWF